MSQNSAELKQVSCVLAIKRQGRHTVLRLRALEQFLRSEYIVTRMPCIADGSTVIMVKDC